VQILQTVIVKQILTETSKNNLLEKYHKKQADLQKECDQLRFERKKMEKIKRDQQASIFHRFEKEISARQEKIKLLDFQQEQLHMLPLGSEIKEKEFQSLVEVHVGDNWAELSREKTIVIKDDIVVEIR
jgi:hypothetical protein